MGIETTTIDAYSGRDTLGSTLNITRSSGNLFLRSKGAVQWTGND